MHKFWLGDLLLRYKPCWFSGNSFEIYTRPFQFLCRKFLLVMKRYCNTRRGGRLAVAYYIYLLFSLQFFFLISQNFY